MKLLIHYGYTSLFNIALDFLIIIALTELFHLYYLFSIIIGFMVSSFLTFFVNKRLVFHSEVSLAFGYSKSMLVAVICLLIISFITFNLTTYFSIYYIYSRLLAGCVGGIVGFVLDKKFTFKA
jgi:putative flippase GtrA